MAFDTPYHKVPRMGTYQCSSENCYYKQTPLSPDDHAKNHQIVIPKISTYLPTSEWSSLIAHQFEDDKLCYTVIEYPELPEKPPKI
ncbi:hypothetical protein ACFX2I_011648 [Malus domestica]